ncbi:flavin-containing monooxygenase [Aspergillus luchuensis]|uniref:Flavin-containing monooxygenase n=1 Tax=Aspergillus kawachii TaxID=1069201 RepID=A0A146F4V1_ASPKA|nr:flavin-containing monooxygenase [Aspergillus luchuensis]
MDSPSAPETRRASDHQNHYLLSCRNGHRRWRAGARPTHLSRGGKLTLHWASAKLTKGQDIFQGEIIHTAQYKSPRPWQGKHGVIIGSANSGTLAADKQQLSTPLAVSRLMSTLTLRSKIAQNPERFDALERAGSRSIGAPKSLRTFMNATEDITWTLGIVKVKSDSPLVRFTSTGLLFEDNTHIPADVVVFATGYKWNARDTVGELFGREVHDRVEDYWGLDKEGEVRGAFKPSPHGHIWFISGTTTHSRYFSRFIALLIKADIMGVPIEVYRGIPDADE